MQPHGAAVAGHMAVFLWFCSPGFPRLLPSVQFYCLKLFLEVEDNLGAGCWFYYQLDPALKYLRFSLHLTPH